jgi:predicted transcriptional regulator
MTDLFDVLADETRRDIVALLHRASGDDHEMSVGELEAFLSAGQSAIQAIKARDGIIDGSARNVESSTMGELAQVIDPKGDSAG